MQLLRILIVVCMVAIATQVRAAPPVPEVTLDECTDAVYANEDLAKKVFSGSQEAFNRHRDLLALCLLHDPYNENWESLQWILDHAAENTGGHDAYLDSLGVSAEQLGLAIEKTRVFHARQAYARFYQLIHWERRNVGVPDELSNLYLAYGALIDPSAIMYRDSYHAQYKQATTESFTSFDKLLGFTTDVKIGEGLKCVGWDGYIGYSTFDLVILCGLNDWPPPVYPLLSKN